MKINGKIKCIFTCYGCLVLQDLEHYYPFESLLEVHLQSQLYFLRCYHPPVK